MNKPVLEFCKVTVRYELGGEPIIAAVSFQVGRGERVALVGLNGSGKTTLLMAAVGLVPHEGEVRVWGELLARKTLARIRDRIGFLFDVPEDQLLFPKVLDDVAFGPLRRGMRSSEASARAKHALDALGVGHLSEAPLHYLSHGEKQRVALAGALATEPGLLLLDEPSAGLDPPGKHALVGVLGRLDAATVIATHDLDFAARLCSRFLILDRGRIVFDGTDTKEVLRRWELNDLESG